ncbi:MAG: hypothetical protein KDD66_05200 [Bdellovibrionales bacterium]|nr:hypothetical protein [Bdellovibrionales bacterium]
MRINNNRAVSTVETLAALCILSCLLSAFWSQLYSDQANNRELSALHSFSSELRVLPDRLRALALLDKGPVNFSAKQFSAQCTSQDPQQPQLLNCTINFSTPVPALIEKNSDMRLWIP